MHHAYGLFCSWEKAKLNERTQSENVFLEGRAKKSEFILSITPPPLLMQQAKGKVLIRFIMMQKHKGRALFISKR
ncbi:hypothetical protein ACH95_02775 [Bacillus glycinifermentans]|nr:hypothetical protein ACH95_02775 [Bacillus glycinifermentans]